MYLLCRTSVQNYSLLSFSSECKCLIIESRQLERKTGHFFEDLVLVWEIVVALSEHSVDQYFVIVMTKYIYWHPLDATFVTILKIHIEFLFG